MNELSLLKLTVQEAKQVGLLYHYTTPEALKAIKNCDCLKAGSLEDKESGNSRRYTLKFSVSKFIATTRNKDLHKTAYFDELGLSHEDFAPPFIRITLDGDKLSQRYKIEPYRYYYKSTLNSEKLPFKDEYEERILTDEIPNLSQYIVRVDNVINQIPHYTKLSLDSEEQLQEAEYQGRKVKLNKPMQGDVKKFKVYVKNPETGKVVKVNFGQKGMSIKKNNPERRKAFRARHNCDSPGPKTKPRYWSCKKW